MSKEHLAALIIRYQRASIIAALISGGLLVLSLPFAFWNISGFGFKVVWYLHLALQVNAVWAVLLLLFHLGRGMGWGSIWYGLLFVFFLLLIGWQSSLPIISRDALIYHLEVPKLWLRAGGISEVPWHEWSYFPLLTSVAYAGFLEHGLTMLTPYYHATYLILSAGLVAIFVFYKYQDAELSIISALICLTIPVCMKLASEPMSDLVLGFYFGLLICFFIFWAEQRLPIFGVLLAGFCLGLALSVKYNSVLAAVVFIPCAFWFLIALRYPARDVFKGLLLLSLASLLVYFPWPLKNLIWTGNPLYPFLGSIFPGPSGLPFMGEINPIEYRIYGYKESLFDVLMIPLRLLFTGQDDNPKQFDGLLSPIFLLAILPIVFKPKAEQRAPWLLFVASFCVIFFASSILLFYALVRYQSPLLVPMVILSAGGLNILASIRQGRYRNLCLRLVVGLHLCWALNYVVDLLKRSDAVAYAQSSSTSEQYLLTHSSEYAIAKYVNENLPPEAVLYLIFTGNRYFYYDREVRGAYFSEEPIVRWLRQSTDSKYLSGQFRSIGVTHFAIHSQRTLSVLQNKLTPEQKRAWTDFVKNELEWIHSIGSISLWKLRK